VGTNKNRSLSQLPWKEVPGQIQSKSATPRLPLLMQKQ